MKKIVMCLATILVIVCSSTRISAEEDKQDDGDSGENLELRTDGLHGDNQRSLTDENQIPLFTDDFSVKENKELLKESELFIEKPVKVKASNEAKELFGSPVIMNEEFTKNVEGPAWNVLIGIGVGILFVGTFIMTKLYYKYKKVKGTAYDINIS